MVSSVDYRNVPGEQDGLLLDVDGLNPRLIEIVYIVFRS